MLNARIRGPTFHAGRHADCLNLVDHHRMSMTRSTGFSGLILFGIAAEGPISVRAWLREITTAGTLGEVLPSGTRAGARVGNLARVLAALRAPRWQMP